MSLPLNFGYLVPTREAVMRAPDGRANIHRMIELAARAEQAGFDSLWVGDSILARPRFEALTTLAAIAARTTRAQLGTAVYLAPLRHPVPLAHAVGNLDLLSGGRLLFGLGLGPRSPAVMAEYAACGADIRKRGLLLEEGLQIMKGLWSGQPFRFHGTAYQLDQVRLHPLPSRAGGPPILLAAAADQALQRVARLADGWLPISPTPESYRRDWNKICDACSTIGREPQSLLRVLYVTLVIDADEERAARQLDQFLQAYYGPQHREIARTQGHCAGSPARCAAFLRGFVEAGVSNFVVRFASPMQEEQMDCFLATTVPLLE